MPSFWNHARRLIIAAPLKLRSIFRRSALEQELDEEFRFYLDQRIEHEIALGKSPQEARRTARLALGSIDQRKEECRDARGTQFIENFATDLRIGARGWRKTPGIWLLATLTLGLGIGANSSVFSIIDTIFYRPLADLDHSRDVVINAIQQKQGRMRGGNTLDNLLAWRASQLFETVVAFRPIDTVVTGITEPERITGQSVSPGFFDLLGAKPALGRIPTEAEHHAGSQKALVISHEFWRNRLAASPDAIGKTIRLDNTTYTIAGVAPKGFWFPDARASFWSPLPLDPTPTSYKERGLHVIGRLKPGASLEQAQASLTGPFGAFVASHPDSHTGWTLRLDTVDKGFYSSNDQQVVTLLYLISAGVLLISCANVANLLLARGLARTREMSIRTALGASRSRIFCQSFTEGLLIALPAAALGLTFGHMGSSLLLATIHVPFPIPEHFLNARALALNSLAAVTSVILFSLYPARNASRKQLPGIPGDGGARATLGAHANRFSRALVVVQVSLGLALVMTAAVGVRGIQVLIDLGPGYDARNLVRAAVTSPRLKPATDPNLRSQILDSLAASNAIESAGWISGIPGVIGTDGIPSPIQSTHRQLSAENRPLAYTISASPGAIEALRLPLLEGRLFDTRDTATAARVAVVNRNLCEQLLPGRSPLGESIILDSHGPAPFRVIGVYANLPRSDFKLPPAPQLFLSFDQAPTRETMLLARYREGADAFPALRAAIRNLDPDAPVDLHTLESELADGLRNGKALTGLIAFLATLALFFGGCGLFAILSQSVTLRLPEIAIRLAIGATSASIRRLVFQSSTKLLLAGAAIGLTCGWLLSGILAAQLVQVKPSDWQVWLPACAVFLLVALAAITWPAFRAGRTEAIRVMRQS
jgi:putative ABC transport system permease protein